MAPDPKDVVRAFVDALNRHDWDRAGRLITPDFTYTIMSYHLPGAETPMDGDTMLKVLPEMLGRFIHGASTSWEPSSAVSHAA